MTIGGHIRMGAARFRPDLRVLVAEDNAVNQLLLKVLLEQHGLQPRLVGDGAQALAAWRAEPWDLILMDVRMPVLDGTDAARAIRAAEQAQGRARTPILALTAMAQEIADWRAEGMDGVIGKPIEVSRLFDAIEAAVTPREEPKRDAA